MAIMPSAIDMPNGTAPPAMLFPSADDAAEISPMKPKNISNVTIESPHRNRARAAVSSRKDGLDRIFRVCSEDSDNGMISFLHSLISWFRPS